MLEALSAFFDVKDHARGQAKIVVAAPHQAPSGTPLSAGHDVNTGIVAQRLAQAVQGKAVVASELRTFIDLNKYPFEGNDDTNKPLGHRAFREADEKLKLYYQSQLFASDPRTVVEIHGHARGSFDIEVSTGFRFDSRVPQDRALKSAVETFATVLGRGLRKSRIYRDSPPTIGVYPLDPAVKFAATGTYTFRKIRRLRELGVNVAGLHVELSRRLRPGPDGEESDSFYVELVRCLKQAVDAFVSALKKSKTFDTRETLVHEFLSACGEFDLAVESPFILQQSPRRFINRRIVTLSEGDANWLQLTGEDRLALSADPGFETYLEFRVETADIIRSGSVGIAKKYRKQLGIRPGEEVYLGQPSTAVVERLVLGYVSTIGNDLPSDRVMVGSHIAQELRKLIDRSSVLALTSIQGRQRPVAIEETESLAHGRAVALSTELARKAQVTFGDPVCIYVGHGPAGVT
jgi:hypothetical protein